MGPALVNMRILIGRGQNNHSPFERVFMHLSMNGMNTTDELLENERMVTERRMKATGSKDLCLWRVLYCFYIDT